MSRRNGFTLIELMIVVAVLGILVAVAIPVYAHYISRARLNTLKNNHVTAISLVRNEISKRNAGGSIYLDTPDEFVDELNRGDKRSVYDHNLKAFATAGTDPGAVVITKNIAVSPPTYQVVAYDASGNPLSGSTISITLE